MVHDIKFTNKYTTETAKEYVKQFDCELLSEYKGMGEKHLFRCSCGNEFETTFAKFQNRNKRQCNKCGRKRANDLTRLDIGFVREQIASLGAKCLSDEYINYKEKLMIQCECGNIYQQSYANFLHGTHHCQKCSQKIADEAKNKYTYEYVSEYLKKHGSTLLTPKTEKYIGYKSTIEIECSCGEKFSTMLEIVLTYEKTKCRSCKAQNSPTSHGEKNIKNYLLEKGYEFYQEYSFPDCKDKYVLRFDFAVVVDNKLKLIEFDGMQHFRPYDYYGGEKYYQKILRRDGIKNKYCEDNNIPLLRIPYTELRNIDFLLDEYLVA